MTSREERLARLGARLSPETENRAPQAEIRTPDTVNVEKSQKWEETHHRTTFWLADDLRAAIRDAAEAEGVSLRVWVDRAFRRALGKEPGQ